MTLEDIHQSKDCCIPCAFALHGEGRVLIASHGFGSSALSRTNLLLLEELPKSGWGVVSYDFPCHGKSEAKRSALRIDGCMDCLAAVERETLRRAPGAEIVYFGSSFGAYITAIYLTKRMHTGRRAFFRSAAVTMPELLLGHPYPGAEDSLARQGWFKLDMEGYVRPLEITAEFLEDLRENDLFALYNSEAKIKMLHGGADEVAPLTAAASFAEKFGAELEIIEGGHHSLSESGQPEAMLRSLRAFLDGRGE